MLFQGYSINRLITGYSERSTGLSRKNKVPTCVVLERLFVEYLYCKYVSIILKDNVNGTCPNKYAINLLPININYTFSLYHKN